MINSILLMDRWILRQLIGLGDTPFYAMIRSIAGIWALYLRIIRPSGGILDKVPGVCGAGSRRTG